jgi:hypothetical protein
MKRPSGSASAPDPSSADPSAAATTSRAFGLRRGWGDSRRDHRWLPQVRRGSAEHAELPTPSAGRGEASVVGEFHLHRHLRSLRRYVYGRCPQWHWHHRARRAARPTTSTRCSPTDHERRAHRRCRRSAGRDRPASRYLDHSGTAGPCDDWRPRGLVSYRSHRGATVSELSQEAAELYLLWRRRRRGSSPASPAPGSPTSPNGCARSTRGCPTRRARGGPATPLALPRAARGDRAGQWAGVPGRAPAVPLAREPVPADTPPLHDHDNAEVFLREHEDLPAALQAHDRDAAERVMRLHLQHSAARGATFGT